MNKKPVLITAGVLVLALCSFLFIRSRYLVKPEKKEVIAFLDQFNADLKQGFTDTLLNYFDGKQNSKQLLKLLGALSNKKSLNGIDTALFDVNLISDDSQVTIINNELTNALVPVTFKAKGSIAKQTTLFIRLRKISTGKFKIIQIDARKFLEDFTAYENSIKEEPTRPTVYDPITLEAFKTAEQLKTRYDSVLWFAHINKKTYYYVVKGKWDEAYLYPTRTDVAKEDYKMGLLDNELKELIPTEYDLIHTIGATFPNMIEVEKGNKKGFYELSGKIAVPVDYEQIFPIEDEVNLAVLKKGADYFYLKKDMSVSEKVDLKISDFFPKIKLMSDSYDLYKKAAALPVITEYNSRNQHSALYIAPSYLVYLNMTTKLSDYKNPLRKVQYEETHTKYDVTFSPKTDVKSDNWLTASFYSIRDYFLGGRSEFYDKKNVVIVDNKNDKLFMHNIDVSYGEEDGDSPYTGRCEVNGIKMINDSLIEIRAAADLNIELYDSTKTVIGGVFYHYFILKNDELKQLPDKRMFGFTQYLKMDDSYLNGCYDMLVGSGSYDTRKKSEISRLTPEILRYIKNEIYASYRYQFKDQRWQTVFANMTMQYDHDTQAEKALNANVDDSLTAIDKYNIEWINNKLKAVKQPKVLAAVK